MTLVFKWLFGLITVATSGISLLVFGLSWWPLVFVFLGLFVIASNYWQSIDYIATLLARLGGVLALLGIALLLIAANVGSSFHLSPSYWVMIGLMSLMAVLGCSGFFWAQSLEPSTSKRE
ncbi:MULTISPECIES: hypothetical protein [unclassified Agarivorans]|uniref:hypothetical protein n=1 Tax=unclassified Agarivorans TaxID=2636026 RepID=UPI0026E1BA50|nr:MULTISPECIES: hypothetical protein [unclassified Agarivorans]MDO6684001.1 hypothetical protein [Agarivorans sp. 3_MG-2023]MDO6714266.1 hypothetical protein [Agarivorans sp. 2_MG-2023]